MAEDHRPRSIGATRDAVRPQPTITEAAPALVAVAHGSRDPRSAATVAALVDEVRRRHPGLDVRLSFLDLSAPRLPDVLGALHAEGHRRAVVVPLLLGRAFHADVDVPGAVRRGRRPGLEVTVADVLGGDPERPEPRLAHTALRRLDDALGSAEEGVRPDDVRSRADDRGRADGGGCVDDGGYDSPAPPRTRLHDTGLAVVLAAAGSSHAPATAAVARVVEAWTARFGWHGGSAAFAAAAEPTVDRAIAQLRAAGARRVAVASWFLAPGRLPDRVARAAAEAGAAMAAPLGTDERVVALVLDRYRDALAVAAHRAAG